MIEVMIAIGDREHRCIFSLRAYPVWHQIITDITVFEHIGE